MPWFKYGRSKDNFVGSIFFYLCVVFRDQTVVTQLM